MATTDFLDAIKAELSSGARVPTLTSGDQFKAALERWSDLDLKIPLPISVIATEADIVKTVTLNANK